jgi:putative NADPH-quinone reductase
MTHISKSPDDHPSPRRILVLFAHPSIDRSEINGPMAEATRRMEGVTFVDLYAEYPTLHIDIEREQQRLLEHDVVIFMHPLYWYSTPAILKEWQDLVLEHDFAYGYQGKALHGKIFFNVTSAGGAEEAYASDGYQHFKLREVLSPLEQMASLCGMIYLPPFAIFSSREAAGEDRLQQHIQDWQRFVKALQDHRINLKVAKTLQKLNIDLDNIILEALS